MGDVAPHVSVPWLRCSMRGDPSGVAGEEGTLMSNAPRRIHPASHSASQGPGIKELDANPGSVRAAPAASAIVNGARSTPAASLDAFIGDPNFSIHISLCMLKRHEVSGIRFKETTSKSNHPLNFSFFLRIFRR